MERADASGGGLDRRLCLERQNLSEPHEGRVCDHRHPLEWTQILWVARRTVEGTCTMNARSTKVVRCAIYTRVSTDQGLEQDFNSLDAQYDASQAYIRSQAHAGWSLLRAKYDDGGFSGGNTDRPALQRLLEDVRAGKVDVIVVYKVDRLTRSLADFAKLVELFDRHNVSFVSVTQQFNTTTSMGRLTLNVLLSFAQFEREVTSERIRDKIAASKRKGLWVGGMAPTHKPLRLEAAILSRMRSEVTSRSNWANDSSTFSVSRPIEVVVLNCWVTDTKDTWCRSNSSTSFAKSASDRVRRSTL